MHTKSVAFDGSTFILNGRVGDDYFDHIQPERPFTFAMGLLPRDAVCFDIGANIGMTAVIAAKRSATVYAFEPDPAVMPFLEATIEANSGTVEAHHMALGAEEGSLSFYSNPISPAASHLVTGDTLGHSSTATVKVSTVDGFVLANNIDKLDFMKIDVEGFEIDVLRGARDTIARLQPAALVEFNSFTMVGFRDINPRDLLRLVLELFPYVYRFKDGRPTPLDSDGAALAFIHDNLVSEGCVDDLYCSFARI